MGLFDFVKDVGAKLGIGNNEAEEAAEEAAKAAALSTMVRNFGFDVDDIKIAFDDGIATVTGTVPNQGEKEKIILALGNTNGVAQVDDQMTVVAPAPDSTFYTVQSGDSLSKIAKAHYGDPMKYPMIFEANKPMLTDPDLIYPGQVLRIPLD